MLFAGLDWDDFDAAEDLTTGIRLKVYEHRMGWAWYAEKEGHHIHDGRSTHTRAAAMQDAAWWLEKYQETARRS